MRRKSYNIKYARILGSFEAKHCWPDAPAEVDFLKNLHRHLFQVEILLEVFHNDRELEYYMIKKQLNLFLDSFMPRTKTTSCEDFADFIHSFLFKKYGKRSMRIKVLEDGLEGAVCCYD